MKRDPDPPADPEPNEQDDDTGEWVPEESRDDGPASSRDMG